MYYRNAVAAVIVFDITSRDSFEQVQGWINELQTNAPNIVIIICGNKVDLDARRAVQQKEGDAVAETAQSVYAEASAATGHGVDFLFQVILKKVWEDRPGAVQGETSGTNPPVEQDNEPCC
jgi:small GTP-binding protein